MPAEPLPKVAVVQAGARNHYLTARALRAEGLLELLVTDLAWQRGSVAARAVRAVQRVGGRTGDRLAGREVELTPARVVARPWLAVSAALRRRLLRGGSPAALDVEVAEHLAELAVAAGALADDVVIGYSGGAGALFRRAAGRERPRLVLDQASATVSTTLRVVGEEQRRWPGWELPLSESSLAPYQRLEEDELALADLILAPSPFVAGSLADAGVAAEKVVVLPYALEDGWRKPEHEGDRAPGRPLRVLFLGTVSLQKGVPYLLEAARSLAPGRFEVRIVGPIRVARERLGGLPGLVEVTGPVPRSRVGAQLAWADVLCLPSVCEGFGLVQLEAMATGLPVVATASSAGIVENGVNGVVVPIRDSVAIVSTLERLEADRDLLAALGAGALRTAQGMTRPRYGARLAELLRARS